MQRKLAPHQAARYTPILFAAYASPYPYEVAPHLELLSSKLLEAATQADKRIIVSMPPRHGKSEMTSHYFPPWYLCNWPNKQLLLAAYESTFAAEWGGKARDTAIEFGEEVFGVHVDKDNSSRDNWRVFHGSKNAGQGILSERAMRQAGRSYSIMRTAGLGGPVTGKGADLAIVDDPVKNNEDALSGAARENKWQWWQSTMYPRLHKNGSAIVVQTRWHEDDLAGRLINLSEEGREEWDIINLPALAEENDILGREPGEPLWPEKFDESRLKKIREVQGAYWFSAMYQGRPAPLEGGYFKRKWFSERYNSLPRMQRVIQTVDAAFKVGLDNDYSVIATWGTDGVNYYVIDIVRAKLEFHELKAAMKDQFWKHQPSGVYVEEAAAGISIIQEFQRESMLPVIGKPVFGNDISRALAITGICEAGKVKLPARAAWVADWVEEHISFPNGAHDDQVATSYYALEELAYAGLPVMEFIG